jgi:hypothetical protein
LFASLFIKNVKILKEAAAGDDEKVKDRQGDV